MSLIHLNSKLWGGLLLVSACVIIYLIRLSWKKFRPWPYHSVMMMSHVEQLLYWRLKEALPTYHIFAQVQLSRLIRPPKGKDEWHWLNKIIRLSVDYVVLNERLETVAVIELDDKSHLLAKRMEADQRKAKALKAAGLRLIRINVTQIPTKQQLAAMFKY